MKLTWTKERCLEDALRYSTRGEFCKESPSAYARSLRCKWIDEVCSHMITLC